MQMERIVNSSEEDIQIRLDRIAQRKNLMRRILPFIGLAFVFLFFLIATKGNFVSPENLNNLIEQCFTITVVAVGATFAYTCGAFDISVGAVLAIAELSIVYLMANGGIPIGFLVLIAVGTAVAFTVTTALISSVLRVNTFIVSLCVMFICNGIVTTAVSQNNLYISYQDYNFINTPEIKAVVLIILVAAGMFIFTRTRLGRDLKALGGNEVAAFQSGVKKVRTYVIAFACMGICLGIAALFSLVRVSMLSSATGGGLGLSIFVAIVLGGFPITGGANSRMTFAIIGALTITFLQNGLSIMGIDPSWTLFIQGLLFLTIVALSYDRSKGILVI